jgi:hypothetical protein
VIAVGAIMAAGAGELYLKVRRPDLAADAGAGFYRARRRNERFSSLYTSDPHLGFRPVLGTDRYSQHGTATNDYAIQKRRGVARLLFIGDSVTARGRIVAAIRRRYGDGKFEYWNAGVHGFNTVQEVEYYRRYNRQIFPDHVILTFHPNDYGTTPIVFRDNSNSLVICALRKPLRSVSPWLFRRSYLYRLFLAVTMSESEDAKGIRKEVAASLKDLRDSAERDGASLTVLVLPYLAPRDQWGEWRVGAREATLGILADLGIRHFDLLGVLRAALAEGISTQERPGDTLHPSEELSDRFAAYLCAQGLLGTREKDQH